MNGSNVVLTKVVVLVALLAADVAVARTARMQPDWTIVYGTAKGSEGLAAELLTGDLGDVLLREPGVYATHVLPCLPAEAFGSVTGNVFLVGTPASNDALARYLRPGDVPEGGYLVRVVSEPTRDVVLLAGDTPAATIWAVSDFVADGVGSMKESLERGNGIIFTRMLFADPDTFRSARRLPPYESRRKPQTLVRSVFTWAHPIDDFRDYIRNLARLKMTRAYWWNDFPPINAAEVVDYAHSWGIEVFWGFPWGWDTGDKLRSNAGKDLTVLAERTLSDWRKNWRDLPGDGIYFQTFTETDPSKIGDESIAARAVRLVNDIAGTMFREKPEQRIVFGLHATSVKDELATIAKTDRRLEILWEDTGSFPYSVNFKTSTEESEAFTQRIVSDRDHPVGIVWKCQLLQDWFNWHHQAGPYYLGVTSRKTYDDDRRIHDELWQHYLVNWTEKAPLAYAAAKHVHEVGEHVEMNVAAQLNGPIRYPTALLSELFFSTEESLETIRRRVLMRTRQH